MSALPACVPNIRGPLRGRIAGQVRPSRILRREELSQYLGRVGTLEQRSSTYGNVVAYEHWVTDGQIELISVVGEPGDAEYIETVRLTGATYAYYVSYVKVAAVLVSHPMVWCAYAETPAARTMLEGVLPYFRCMSMNTFSMFFRNWPAVNGGWTFLPGSVTYASYYPHFDPYYLPAEQWPKVVVPARSGTAAAN